MLADDAVDIDLDGVGGDLAPFAVLDDLADRARVAYLGEMDHFVAEKYDFRLLCIRYLASRGWRVVGEEWPEREHQRPFTRGILANDRQPTAALDDAQDRFHDALRRVVPDVEWFSFDADVRDSEYVELASSAETYEALKPAMALRERIMHDKVGRALADHPDDKVVLLAAAQHLLKDDDRVHPKAGTSGPGGGIVRSIGHHVAHELTDAPVLSLWFLHGEGTSANPWLPPPAQLEPQAGTFDAELLARHGAGPCLVRVADDHHRRAVTAMHNTVLQCRFSEQVDAIVFAPRVSPLVAPPAS